MAEKLLIIPLELDALYLKSGITVADAARLNELPWFNGRRDVNGSNAFLSETILNQPFQNKNTFLPPGLHLHWFLPSAFMDGRIVEEQQSGSNAEPVKKMEYSAVPNRWMIYKVKGGTQDTNPEIVDQWLVESDYLHDPAEGEIEGAVPLPYQYPYSDPNKGQFAPPFCFTGRVLHLSENPGKENHDGETKYISDIPGEKLHAMSGGSFEFPLIYPFCKSIFGFHDPAGDPNSDHYYYVLGWNADSELDNLEKLVSEEDVKEAVINENCRSLNEVIAKKLGWQLNDELLDRKGIAKIVCFASLTFRNEKEDCAPDTKLSFEKSEIELAVGNSREEALCGYLAQHLIERQEPKIAEQQLSLLNYFGDLEDYTPDKKINVAVKAHFDGFTAMPGQELWQIIEETEQQEKVQEQKKNSSAKEDFELPENLIALLCNLNGVQKEIDQLEGEIKSMRHQLFVDWYKYMMSAYPLEDGLNHYPDPDLIKQWLETASIKKDLQSKEELLQEKKSALNALLADAKTQLNIEQKVGKKLNLTTVPAPRYWTPVEPTILLLEDTKWASQERVLTPTTNCEKLKEVEAKIVETSFEDLLSKEHFLSFLENVKSPYGTIHWKQQPWKPFILAWGVELASPKNGNNRTTQNKDYSAEYIRNNYSLKETALDVVPTSDDLANSNVYFGFCLLTADTENSFAKSLEKFDQETDPENSNETIHPLYTKASAYYKALKQNRPRDYQIESYIREFLPEEFPLYDEMSKRKKSDPDPKKQRELLCSNLKELLDWFRKEDKNTGRERYRILNLGALSKSAGNLLKDKDFLSQSLGGFNEALLMRKKTLQLKVDEPLGFESYRDFSELVHEYVGEENKTAPLPLNDFSPIRAGNMNFVDLELIDTFGRIRKLNWKKVHTPSVMDNKNFRLPVYLPPRLVQPARLNFKLLPASETLWDVHRIEHDACHDKNTSPICGWLLPDNLNEGLLVYDAEGEILGSINLNSEWSIVPGKMNPPADTKKITAEHVPNPHLRKIVNHLLQYGNKQSDVSGLGFLKQFSLVINNALQNINPEAYKNSNGMVLFVGRPVAVVRASFNLELQEYPALNQSWPTFEHALQADKTFGERDNDRFTAVKFPVRVGNFRKLSDGVIGYWKEQEATLPNMRPDTSVEEQYIYENNLFYAQNSDAIESEYIETQYWNPDNLKHLDQREESPMNFEQSIESPPQRLTLLIDPTNPINITSGILPNKEIKVPEELYLNVLRKMQVSLLINPVIMEKNGYSLPLPGLPGVQWHWLEVAGVDASLSGDTGTATGKEQGETTEKSKIIWNKIEQTPLIEKKVFMELLLLENKDGQEIETKKEACWQELLQKEWLKKCENSPLFIAVALLKEPEELQDLNENFQPFKDNLLYVLKRSCQYLASDVSMDYVSNSEIREGWLLLERPV